jgi:hypothetical protein
MRRLSQAPEGVRDLRPSPSISSEDGHWCGATRPSSREACLKPKLTDDWDKERKKQKVLSLVLVALLLVAAVLFIISLLRKYL